MPQVRVIVDGLGVSLMAGIGCGMFAILVHGLVQLVRTFHGGDSSEEILDRLDRLDERLANMESSTQHQQQEAQYG